MRSRYRFGKQEVDLRSIHRFAFWEKFRCRFRRNGVSFGRSRGDFGRSRGGFWRSGGALVRWLSFWEK